MKVVLIGASGTIGKAVGNELAKRHEVIAVGSKSGDYRVDMRYIAQVRELFAKIGKVDAVVVTAGSLAMGPLTDLTPEQFQVGLSSKLMGQVNVAQVAALHLNDGGSITLTSGIASEHPFAGGAIAALVNSGVEGYVRGAAVDLQRGLRINVVSPTVLEESLEVYGDLFIGVEPAPGARVALAYSRSVNGVQTGQVYKVW